jgi:hypothetical protein
LWSTAGSLGNQFCFVLGDSSISRKTRDPFLSDNRFNSRNCSCVWKKAYAPPVAMNVVEEVQILAIAAVNPALYLS